VPAPLKKALRHCPPPAPAPRLSCRLHRWRRCTLRGARNRRRCTRRASCCPSRLRSANTGTARSTPRSWSASDLAGGDGGMTRGEGAGGGGGNAGGGCRCGCGGGIVCWEWGVWRFTCALAGCTKGVWDEFRGLQEGWPVSCAGRNGPCACLGCRTERACAPPRSQALHFLPETHRCEQAVQCCHRLGRLAGTYLPASPRGWLEVLTAC
jgi:hypothetical protein